MSLVLLAISLSIALGVLAFRFAVFALPVMAGIAAHFGDAELGDLARKTERELKLNTDDGALAAAIDELQTWFER